MKPSKSVSPSNLQEQEEPLLIHIAVAAAVLGLTIRQTRGLCEDGALASTVIKRKTYIPAASVREYVEGIRGVA